MTAEAAAVTTYQIDPKHSSIEFAVKHLMFTTVKGRFASVTGSITVDESNHANSSVEATIDVSSIDTREEQRDQHLKSPDFFHADEHPSITFKSTRVEHRGNDRLHITGDLTIHGTTRSVVLDTTSNGKAKSPWGQEVISFSAETQINRKDFGLVWNVALETGGVLVGENVKISLDIEAVKQ